MIHLLFCRSELKPAGWWRWCRRIDGWVLACLFLLMLAACATVTPGFESLTDQERESLSEDLYRTGSYYIQRGDFERGNQLIDSAILVWPTTRMYRSKATRNGLMGNYAEAMRALEVVVEYDSAGGLSYRGWFKLHFLRDYSGAIEDLKAFDALVPGPDHAEGQSVYLQLGLAYKQLEKFEQARAYLDSCIVEEGKNGEKWIPVYAFVHRGIVQQKLKNYNEALDDFNRAIRNCETCAEPYYFRGQTLLELGQKKEACQDLKQALTQAEAGYLRSYRNYEYIDQIYLQDITVAVDNYCE